MYIFLLVWVFSALISLFFLVFNLGSSKYCNRLSYLLALLGFLVYIALIRYRWSAMLTKDYWLKNF